MMSQPADQPALLRAHELHKNFGPTTALRGVSLEIKGGEVVAITGPSGSGKSTLMHCLSGILLPDAGEVIYAGERLDMQSETRRSELRRTEFGILFQFGQLVPELTAEENVALPILLAGERRGPALEAARTILDSLGVGDLAANRPGEMSGGQGQRVALARALVISPHVVFADEPTGALDSLAGEQVLAGLVRLANDAGAAVVMVTHDAGVAAYADREIVMHDGCLNVHADAGARPVGVGASLGSWL